MIRPTEKIRFHGYPIAGVDAMAARTARSFPRHTRSRAVALVREAPNAAQHKRQKRMDRTGSVLPVACRAPHPSDRLRVTRTGRRTAFGLFGTVHVTGVLPGPISIAI